MSRLPGNRAGLAKLTQGGEQSRRCTFLRPADTKNIHEEWPGLSHTHRSHRECTGETSKATPRVWKRTAKGKEVPRHPSSHCMPGAVLSTPLPP